MSNHVFDVMTTAPDGSPLKLGRTWLNEKEGKYRLGFDLSSLPIGGAAVQLVSEEPWAIGDCPPEFSLKMPIEKKDKQVYWHPVGTVTATQGAEHAFDVAFHSIPLAGNLQAFPARGPKADSDPIPFG